MRNAVESAAGCLYEAQFDEYVFASLRAATLNSIYLKYVAKSYIFSKYMCVCDFQLN